MTIIPLPLFSLQKPTEAFPYAKPLVLFLLFSSHLSEEKREKKKKKKEGKKEKLVYPQPRTCLFSLRRFPSERVLP